MEDRVTHHLGTSGALYVGPTFITTTFTTSVNEFGLMTPLGPVKWVAPFRSRVEYMELIITGLNANTNITGSISLTKNIADALAGTTDLPFSKKSWSSGDGPQGILDVDELTFYIGRAPIILDIGDSITPTILIADGTAHDKQLYCTLYLREWTGVPDV